MIAYISTKTEIKKTGFRLYFLKARGSLDASFPLISTSTLLCFYKIPRILLLIIQKKHDSARNNRRESPDLPLVMGSSHIPLQSSPGKSINGCLTLAGILCTHSRSFAAPASCQHQLQSFFLQGWQLPPCLSAPASAAQRHL